ncbi:MAG: flagellar basal body rod protein FlgC [Phycisphaerae bacterium]|nr:flagellar basal body rod protein FlgC [Phycisphaerae bacterium]
MYGALDISTAGMLVQRTRVEVASANIAGAGAVRDADGNLNPYRRRTALIAAGDPEGRSEFARQFGVRVAEIAVDDAPAQPRRYDPDHPDAYPDGPYKGYVAESNVNTVLEQINAMEAARAYEANVVAAEVTKQMMAVALRLIG